MHEPAAAGRQRQASGFGLDTDVPGLRAGPAPVEYRTDRQTGSIREVETGRDGRRAISREEQFSLGQKEGPRQDAGEDRKGIDAGIEHSQPARLPDPGLARMPDLDVFFPFDDDRFD